MANIQFKLLPLSAPSLFPEDIFEKISVNHPVRSVSEVVNQLDIDAIIKHYKGGGNIQDKGKGKVGMVLFLK